MMAKVVATWSKDPETKVGAIIVSPDMRLISPGYNGFPRGVHDTSVRLDSPEIKNQLMQHAELNAMDNANQSIAGWTLYCTKPCCHRCALSIINRGIVEVYIPHLDQESSWFQEQQLAIELMREANVNVYHITEHQK